MRTCGNCLYWKFREVVRQRSSWVYVGSCELPMPPWFYDTFEDRAVSPTIPERSKNAKDCSHYSEIGR